MIPPSRLAFSSGLEFTTRDEEGYPELALNNEKTVDPVKKCLKLLVNNESVYSHSDNHGHVSKFGNGTAIFLINRFFTAGWEQLRTMEDDYGILPMPKFDENIEGYRTVNEDNVLWGAVPTTIQDAEFVSAVAEVLAYESYNRTSPAYLENTLKLKLTRDDDSMRMVDIIMDSRDTDFLFINPVGSLQRIFRTVCEDGENTFASRYAASETEAKTNIASTIEIFKDSET